MSYQLDTNVDAIVKKISATTKSCKSHGLFQLPILAAYPITSDKQATQSPIYFG